MRHCNSDRSVFGGVASSRRHFCRALALASDDQVAKQLGLSDETRQALSRLVNQRESDALELWQEVKDLPADQRAAKLVPFREESERMGLKLLTAEQRDRLQQLRLEHDGLASIADPSVAKQLQITPEQQAKIDEIMKERGNSLARATQAQRKNQLAYYETRPWATSFQPSSALNGIY